MLYVTSMGRHEENILIGRRHYPSLRVVAPFTTKLACSEYSRNSCVVKTAFCTRESSSPFANESVNVTIKCGSECRHIRMLEWQYQGNVAFKDVQGVLPRLRQETSFPVAIVIEFPVTTILLFVTRSFTNALR